MTHPYDRRAFLKTASAAACAGLMSAGLFSAAALANQENKDQPTWIFKPHCRSSTRMSICGT